jgi:hypothetical protein
MTDHELDASMADGTSGLSAAPIPDDEPDPHNVVVEHGIDGSTTYVIDQDGDGYADVVAVDVDGDGRIDRYAADTNYDGVPDRFSGGRIHRADS